MSTSLPNAELSWRRARYGFAGFWFLSLLGAWFVAQGTLFLLGLVALAAQLGRLRASPALRRALNGLGGLLFIALAVRIVRAGPVAS